MENGTTDPVTSAALASVATAFLVWLSGKGWPLIKEWLGLMGQREKDIAIAAKEGPIMVLEEVKRQLVETKEQASRDKAEQATRFLDVIAELKEIRKQHHDCETKYAALQAEVTWLRCEVADVRNEGGK
jgi:hypothetical protein